MTVYLID